MKRKKETFASVPKKNARYIETLLKTAEKRKKEYERRIDKKIHAEREKEGDKYKDKAAFVTSSYKKKMQEMEEEEERERQENMISDMMDVTKQKDLSGFYRHFLKQTVGEERVPVFGEKEIKTKVSKEEDVIDRSNDKCKISNDVNSDKRHITSSDSKKLFNNNKKSFDELSEKSSDSDHQWHKTSKREKIFKDKLKTSKSKKKIENKKSTDSESESNENMNASSEIISRCYYPDKCKTGNSRREEIHNSRHDSSDDDHKLDKKYDNEMKESSGSESKKMKSNIYAKHTTGNVFAEAQARYFQRLAN